jgi:methylenetetrahydrofolate dehydrogenase (NADP+)/methenyltetrahydrofolate cyclohydrolase
MVQLIDGKSLSNKIIDEIRKDIDSIRLNNQRLPGLAVILVGNDPASSIYVGKKEKVCNAIGIRSLVKKYDNTITEKSLIEEISLLNNDNNIDGILIQLPLPFHINQRNIIESVRPEKDVDGFHPVNIGNLFLGYNTFVPCTPLGIIKLLDYYNINIKSKRVVILGRSNIVGKPLIPLLLQRDATVTTCHSKTINLSEITKEADIIIAAIGKPNYVKREFIGNGAVVIDVGINRVDGKITGDVCFDDVKNVASFITPVPGGVGPMTIAMLMHNTLKAYRLHI